MARHGGKHSSFCFLLYLCLLASLLHSSVNGFRLKLIHRDSVHSPFYPGPNISKTELLQRDVRISKARMMYLQSMINTMTKKMASPDTITPPIGIQQFVYLVMLGIGTPEQLYYMIMDTGSHLSWIQCQPCISCFPQNEPIFDPTHSSTYTKLHCNHPLCTGLGLFCSNHDCGYQIIYATPSQTRGFLSTETITSDSSDHGRESLPNIAIGCSVDNTGFPFEVGNAVAGLVGLGPSPTSLLSQLGPAARGRFSYCLVTFGVTSHSYLRFGDDATIHGQVQQTPLLSHALPAYYVKLDDISIGDHKLGLPPGTFDVRPDNRGGTIIDSGSVMGWMQPNVYGQIRDYLVNYFRNYNLELYHGPSIGLDLCYTYKEDMHDYPPMTYHFQGADLVLQGEKVFFIVPNDYFCLAMLPDNDGVTVLGAWQQHNIRFVFDSRMGQLFFAPEDCSQDG